MNSMYLRPTLYVVLETRDTGHWPPQYLADQLTLYPIQKRGRADYPHLLLLAPLMFFTFRHRCTRFSFMNCSSSAQSCNSGLVSSDHFFVRQLDDQLELRIVLNIVLCGKKTIKNNFHRQDLEKTKICAVDGMFIRNR